VELTGITQPINYSAPSCVINDIYGLTTAEMKQMATYTNYGWDFEEVWDINPEINDGFPFLRNMPAPSLQDNETDNTIKPNSYHIVYPNPIRVGNVNIKTNIPGKYLKINIYNIKGQLIKKLDWGSFIDKESILIWNKRDEFNQEVSAGIYLYRIVSDKGIQSGKFLIIK
jgi:hypothetical protein